MKKIEKLSDERLIVYIREKDKQAFSYILDRYEGKITAYIRRLTNNSPEAEDLVQNVFIKIFENLFDFNEKKKFSSWLYRIAHNLSINWLRKKKAVISIDESEFLQNSLKTKDDIFQETLSKEKSKEITRAINSLPDKFKEPFILKFIEDKSYQEISDILRKPKNTVGTFILRAKKILRQKLNNK
jgi:RNA polymerase sigma-70 factor (ECF subfamily)